MNERDLFLAALDIEDDAARTVFLHEQCGDDAELLTRVQRLLSSHESQSQFLVTPAVEQIAENSEAAGAVTQQMSDGFNADKLSDGPTSPAATLISEQDDADEDIPLGYLEPSDREDSLGRLKHYEILEVVGRGAFGIVLKAFDESLQRVVAIKVLSPELAATSPARKRFQREAESSGKIRHENVVSIYAVEADPIPYLVMEYIPGETLQQRLDGTGPLEIVEVLRLGKQMADGLAAAHAQGLIHRDIKPGNILLETSINDHIKITDFGLARAADDASMTRSGVIAGTPMYMAPEQALGQKLDQRVDLFSLGSVLYQMVSGRPPFRAPSTVAVLKRVAEDTPRPIQEIIPETPDWMCNLIGHLHAKDPEDRFSSAQEVSELLGRCLEDLQNGRTPDVPAPVSATDETAYLDRHKPRVPQRTVGRSLAQVAAGGILLLVGLGFTEATGVTKLTNTVIRLANGSGTLIIETNDPNVTIAIDGEEITIQGGGVKELTLRAGEYKIAALKDGQPFKQELVSITRNGRTVLRMSIDPAAAIARSKTRKPGDGWHDWPTDAPPPAIAPFDAEQAKAHQEAWAKYLGVPVEYTNSIGMKFRLIPPGEFLMGSTQEEITKAAFGNPVQLEWLQQEGPQHKVILTKPLYFGVTEVTQAQYEQIMGSNPSHFSSNGNGKDAVVGLATDNHPVEMVSWTDAAKFCSKLSQQQLLQPFYLRSGEVLSNEGSGYRLPTEAEWEHACRAGTTTWYWSGDDVTRAGWWSFTSQKRTHSVGELKPNPFGLADVHGNVFEWVQDQFDPEFYAQFAKSPALDPFNSLFGSSGRGCRGGCFGHSSYQCRSSFRHGASVSRNESIIGFRVVLPVDAVRKSLGNRPVETGRSQFFQAISQSTSGESNLSRVARNAQMSDLEVEFIGEFGSGSLYPKPYWSRGARLRLAATRQLAGRYLLQLKRTVEVAARNQNAELGDTALDEIDGQTSGFEVWYTDGTMEGHILANLDGFREIEGSERRSWDILLTVTEWSSQTAPEVTTIDYPVLKHAYDADILGSNGKLAVSPDGKLLATLGDALRIWDVESGKQLKSYELSRVTSAVFLRNDPHLIAMGLPDVSLADDFPGKVLIWNFQNEAIVRELPIEAGEVHSLSLSPDGKYLAIGAHKNDSGQSLLWNLETFETQVLVDNGLSQMPIQHVAFTPDGKYVVTTTGDIQGTTRLFDFTSTEVPIVSRRTYDHAIRALTVSPDSQLLAVARDSGRESQVQLLELPNMEIRNSVVRGETEVRAVAFSPDGRLLATGGAAGNGEVCLLDAKTLNVLTRFTAYRPRTGALKQIVSDLAFSSDGRSLLTAADHESAKLWRLPQKIWSEPDQAGAASWVPLFNGQDLTGWKTHPAAPGNWRVEDGLLVSSGTPSYLFSDRGDYRDFELSCEVSINLDGDGGVFGRVPFQNAGKDGLPGYEAQIQSGRLLAAGWATGAIAQSDPGIGWRLKQSTSTVVAQDSFFPLTIKVIGNRVETYVKGKKAAEYEDPERVYQTGHIALQHSGENTVIKFRKIEIQELNSNPHTSTNPELDRLVELAEQDLKRVKLLSEKGVIPDSQVDQSEIALAEAKLKQAQAKPDWPAQEQQYSRLAELHTRQLKRVQTLLEKGVVTPAEVTAAERQVLEMQSRWNSARAARDLPAKNFTDQEPEVLPASDSTLDQ